MSTENKVIDVTIDENVPFGMVLQFLDVDEVTGVETPINMTGYTLRGSISKTLEGTPSILAQFTTAIVDPAQGIASISLSKAQISTLAAAALPDRDKYNPRVRQVGFYDVILTRSSLGSETSSTRIMEGRISVSDGVTV